MGTADERLGRQDHGDEILDERVKNILYEIALAALTSLAKHGDFHKASDVHQLREITDEAYYFAKNVRDSDETSILGHRIGASLAVMLIIRGAQVFRRGKFPASKEWWAGTDYIVNAAASAAEDATEVWPFRRIKLLYNPDARTTLVSILTQFNVDRGQKFSPLTAVQLAALALAAYNRPEDPEFLKRVWGAIPRPNGPTQRGSWRRVVLVGVIAAALLVTGAVLGATHEAGEATDTTSTANTSIAPSNLPRPTTKPAIPPTPPQVDMLVQLPNTDVELFVVNGDAEPSGDLRTMSGSRPDADVVVVPFEGVIEFELWVGIRDEAFSGDRLQVSVRTAEPTVITDASDDRLVEKKPIDVDLRLDPTDRGFRFELTAAADDSGNVGYWCGYNAKTVEVLVSATGNLQTAAITPYPLYVLYAPETC